MDATKKNEQPVDLWRDSLVRYLGYSNELGESFRPIAPRFVVPSYAVAFAYVLGDTVDKASRASDRARAQNFSAQKRNAVIADAAIDTLLWQTMVPILLYSHCPVIAVSG